MNYNTRPDEDDGFGHIIPLCQVYTLSRVNPQSRAFAVTPGGTLIGPVVEVQIVKVLDQYGLEIAIPSPNDAERSIFPMADSDPVQTCSMNFKNLEEESLAQDSQILASRRLVRPMFSSHTGNKGDLCEHSRHFSQPSVPSHAKNHSYERKKVEGYSRQFLQVSQMVTRMVHHYDQDERQSDAAHDKASTAESVCKTWSTRFLREALASTCS